MKRLILIICTTLVALTGQAGVSGTRIVMSLSQPTEVGGDWMVEVSMDNPDEVVTSLQFDLSIPEDFSYTAGNYRFSSRCQETKYGREVDTHSLVSTSTENGGTVRVIIYSNDNKPIQSTSGAVVAFYLSGMGTANATPCNLTNVVASTLDENGEVNLKPSYPQAVIGDATLPCYDAMDDDVLVIGALTEAQLEELDLCLSTNDGVKVVDLTACTNESLGALNVQGEETMLFCHHKGQVSNEVNVVYPEEGTWKAALLHIDDAQQEYELPMSIEADKVQYIRTFGNTEWQAFYLPVELPVSALADFDLARITWAEQQGDEVRLMASTTMPETLLANTPYLIRAHEAGAQTVEAEHVEAKPTTTEPTDLVTDDYQVHLTGTYSVKTDMFQTDAYALSGGVLKQPSSASVRLGCFRWFLTVTGTQSVKMCSLFFDDETTGIALTGDNALAGNEAVCDLTGRRVPVIQKKGLYINKKGEKRIWK